MNSEKKEEGLIQVYTGKGRGKTTSAAGQAIRAYGHGLGVVYVTFFKGGDRFRRGIVNVFEDLEIEVENFCEEHPSFGAVGEEKAREDCLGGLDYLDDLFETHTADLLILDEVLICLRDEFLTRREFERLLDRKPKNLELVLTGRGAPAYVIERADLVSRVECVKHPAEKGVPDRRGLDY